MKTSKLVMVYGFFFRLSPYFRLLLNRWIYNKLALKNNSKKNIFLNYGYQDETSITLKPNDESNRFFIQLYQRAVQDIDLRNKDIAEVGCGQGAGGAFLIEYHQPHSYIGIDLSEEAIELCQQHNQFPNSQWKQACADNLPIPDNSIDVVVNVESSHLYPSMSGFLSEVHRILKPSGYLAFVDLRHPSQLDALDQCFSTCGLQVLKRTEITSQVFSSLTCLSDRRLAHIIATYPKIWHKAASNMSAVKGSAVYNSFINGQLRYFYYLLQKQ